MNVEMTVDVMELLKKYDAVVFDKDNCGQCKKTEDLMADLNINFITVNMSHDKDALHKVKSDGHRSAPAVYTNSENWSGHQEDKIRSLASGETGNLESQDDDTWDF